MKKSGLVVLALLSFFYFVPSLLAGGPVDLRLQVAAGEVAPGLDGKQVILGVGGCCFNNRGQIAFSATIGDPEPRRPLRRGAWGIFLKDQTGIKKVLLEGDILPGGEVFSVFNDPWAPPFFAINESGALAIVDPRRGVLLFENNFFRWLVRKGDPAPDSSSFQSFSIYFDSRFFNDRNEIAFQAQLSDSTGGIFLASDRGVTKIAREGELLPERAGRKFEAKSLTTASFTLTGNSLAFVLRGTAESKGLFVFSESVLRAVVASGDLIPGMDQAVKEIGTFDVNAAGQLAFTTKLNTEQAWRVFIWSSRSGFQAVAGPTQRIPGFPATKPDIFSDLSLDDKGRLFFAAQIAAQKGGFFLWDRGEIQKIVLDGDPTPIGGVYQIGVRPTIFIYPGFLSFNVTRMNSSREVSFLAFVTGGTESTGPPPVVPFIWRAGLVEPILTDGVALSGRAERLIDRLSTVAINEQGEVLLHADLCCGGFSSAVFTSAPAAGRIQYLPYLAVGEDPGSSLHLRSQVELFNHSPFPAFVSVEVFDSVGNALGLSRRDLILEAGATIEIGLDERKLATGYLKMRAEGGADVTLSGTLQIIRSLQLETQTALSSATPVSSARLIVEKSNRANTGIALSNVATAALTLELRLQDAQGRELRQTSLQLSPGQQRSLFIDQLFENLPQEFLGTLRVTSGNPFLIAGLRMNELKLSTLPIDSTSDATARRRWSFTNVFPTMPEQWWTDSLKDALWSPAGKIAVVTGSNEIKLITSQGVVEILNRQTVLPGAIAPVLFSSPCGGSPCEADVILFGFNRNEELLFGVPFAGPPAAGIFLWKDGKIQKIAVTGDRLSDGSAVFPVLSEEMAHLNDSGLIALAEGNGLLIWNQSLRRLLSGIDRLPDDPNQQWVTPRGADLNQAGRMAFVTDKAVGLYDGTQVKVVARVGQSVGGFVLNRLFRVRITETGRVFFTASSGTFGLEGRTGLFLFDGRTITSVLIEGDPTPGAPERALGPVENLNAAFPDSTYFSSPFQTNRHNLLMVFVPRAGFFLLDDGGKVQPILLSTPDAPVALDTFSRFHWNDANQLLFEGKVLLGDIQKNAVILWKEGNIERVIAEGDRISAPIDHPALLRYLNRAWTLSNFGLPLFQATIFGQGVSGLYLATPEHLQQHFVPQIVQGQISGVRYASELLIHSRSTTASLVKLDLHASDGSVFPSWREVKVGANEIRKISLGDGEEPALSSPFVGWLSATVSGGDITLFARLSAGSGNQTLLSELTIPSVRTNAEGFLKGLFADRLALDTGIAFVNPHNLAVDVEVQLLRSPGRQVWRRTTLSLPPSGHRAILLSELFPNSMSLSTLIRFRSPLPLAALALKLNGARITSQPVVP